MPNQSEGIGALYETQLDLLLYHWRQSFRGKLHDLKFVNCIRLIQNRTNLIMTELRDLKASASLAEFDWVFNARYEYLDGFSRLCYLEGSEEAEKIEAAIKDLWPKPPRDLVPRAPQLDIHDSTHHGNHHHLGSDLAVGATARHLHHRAGVGPARGFEFAGSSAIHESLEDSTSPIRDRILSGAAHLATLETVALALPRLPAYLTVTAIHGVEEVARQGEDSIHNFLTTHSHDEYIRDVTPEMRAEGMLDLYELAQVGQMALQAAQVPGQALHLAHDTIVEQAGDLLDAMGITDANLSRPPPVLPPQMFVP